MKPTPLFFPVTSISPHRTLFGPACNRVQSAFSLAFALLLSFAYPSPARAQQKQGVFSDIAGRINKALLERAENPVLLPAAIQTGRVALIKKDAPKLGLQPLKGKEYDKPNQVLGEFYTAIDKLEEQRNQILSEVRQKPHFRQLPRSVLNAIFEKKALDQQLVAVRSASSGWQIWKGLNRKWERNEEYDVLVRHAVEVRYQSLGFLYILYPSDLVSRSGLWELDQLKNELGI